MFRLEKMRSEYIIAKLSVIGCLFALWGILATRFFTIEYAVIITLLSGMVGVIIGFFLEAVINDR